MDVNAQAMNSKSFIELFEWSEHPLEGGEGSFGVVYKVGIPINVKSNQGLDYIQSCGWQGIFTLPFDFFPFLTIQSYACKVIKQGPGMNVDDIRNEIRAIKKVSKSCHPNIVNILSISKDTWENKPAYFIQMELCDGDMDGYIRERYRQGKSFSGLEIADIMVQVLEGLVFLHNHDEVHRDMKPKNGSISVLNRN
jgi:serine/threonine protein kinase